MVGSRGWIGDPDPHLGKLQVAIGVLRNTGTFVRTSLEKQLDPLGPIAFRGRYAQPFLKCVEE